MWIDLQEAFYLALGPFIVSILLPLFVGGGLVAAAIMVTSRFWQRRQKIDVVLSHDDT